MRQEGDVDARIWIRIARCEQSLAIIEQIMDSLPRSSAARAVTLPLRGNR